MGNWEEKEKQFQKIICEMKDLLLSRILEINPKQDTHDGLTDTLFCLAKFVAIFIHSTACAMDLEPHSLRDKMQEIVKDMMEKLNV